jgi:hypothetical protein
MNKILNQFRRIYSDDGRHDVDFSEREEALQEAKRKVVVATTHLIKASERLNTAALKAFPAKGNEH